uniref:Homeobox domain-containing protein n=1 Tax=Schistosoma mansoni TaxID=6183 RepID=A0A5K4FAC9_SCHMA
MECKLVEDCQHNTSLPLPTAFRNYGLYLPLSIPPDLTPMTSPLTSDPTSTVTDSKQDTPRISHNRRETPEGFTMPHNSEISPNQLNLTSETETSFMSLVPNELINLTTSTPSNCIPTVDSSVRNAKSSIDFLADINNETLMLNQSKCYTPMVFISKKASPYPLMEKMISSSQTVGSFDRKQKKDNYAQLDVISDNHDVLKWDYAGDIASHHLGVPRIISHSSLSCHPINYVDCTNYDVNTTMTWPSSSPHISPSSVYGYTVRRKYNFNTRTNSNRNQNEASLKKKGFPEFSSITINHGSFISSPDPEDELHTLPLNYSIDQINDDDDHHHPLSPLNCFNIDDEDLIKYNLNTNSSEFSLNDENDYDNIEKLNLNKSQSVIELHNHNHLDNVWKGTQSSEEYLRQHLDHLLLNIDNDINTLQTITSFNNDWLKNESPEPCIRTMKALKSIDINNQMITNDVTNKKDSDINDNNNEQETLMNHSVESNCQLVKEFNENNHNNNDELQSPLGNKQHDLSSLKTTSVLNAVEMNSLLHTKDNIPKQEISAIQSSTCSKDLSQLPLNDFNESEGMCYIVDGVLSSIQDTNNYSAITTVTPLNENICYQNGFDAESEGCRSSVIMDENCDKEVSPYCYDIHNEFDNLFIKNTDIKMNEISESFTSSIQSGILSTMTKTTISATTTTNKINICKTTQNDLLTTECKSVSDGMNVALSKVYPSILSSGIQIVTHYTTHNSPYLHYATSKIESNNLPEYVPSQYSNLSMIGHGSSHFNHVIRNIPTSLNVLSQTDTSSMKPDYCLSFSSVENKVPRNKFHQTKMVSTENNDIRKLFHIPKNSTRPTVGLPSFNSSKTSKDSPSVCHQHIRSTVTSTDNTGITPCALLTQNLNVQRNENIKPRERLTCEHPLSRDDFETSSVILSPICPKQPTSDHNHRTVQNDVKAYKMKCNSTHLCSHFEDNVKKFDTKLVQTTDLYDENECTCHHTYRIQPDNFKDSGIKTSFEWVEKLLACHTKLVNNKKYAEESMKRKMSQSVCLTPRSTLIAQMRYILLKQKLKLLHTRDAYYLRKRIVNHLEKFLEQIVSSNAPPLSNSVPDDWDTDTESLLSDLFEKDINLDDNQMNKFIPISKDLKSERNQKCRLSTDEYGEDERIHEKVLSKRSSSCDGEICGRTSQFEVAQKDVQKSGRTNKTECKDNDKQFTDITKRSENQSNQIVMHLQTGQPSLEPLSCMNFIYNDHHVKCEKLSKDHCLLNTNFQLYPSSENIVNGLCAALGGISWFQPLNEEKRQSIKNHSIVIKHSKFNDHLSLKNNSKSFNETCSNSKSVYTSKISYSIPTYKDIKNDQFDFNDIDNLNNHSLPSEGNDIYSCQCNMTESPDIINDNSQEQTVTLRSLEDMQCTNLHHMENTTLNTVDKLAYEEKRNSLSNPKITYEISDNPDGYTDIQGIFRKKMSSWISRSEERQRRLRFIIQERRYRKEKDMKRAEVLNSAVSNNFSKQPSVSHLDQSYKNHFGNGIHSNCDSRSCCCCFDRPHCSTLESVPTNRNNSNNCFKMANSDKAPKRNFIKNPSRKSQVGIRYERKQSIQKEYRPRLSHNSIQNQVNQQKIKLAQLRVNRLRMKIYSEKILRSVLHGNTSSIVFKEI